MKLLLMDKIRAQNSVHSVKQCQASFCAILQFQVDFDDVVQTIIPNVRTQFAELRGTLGCAQKARERCSLFGTIGRPWFVV